MNKITKFSFFGLPTIIGLGLVLVGNRIIKNENQLKDRELDLKLQLNKSYTP